LAQHHSFAAMKTTGAQLLQKLNVLLAVLLCSVLAFAQPVTAQPASKSGELHLYSLNDTDEAPLTLLAGHFISGESLGASQVDKSLLFPLVCSLLHKLYSAGNGAAPAPHSYPASRGDCGLHSILIKGT
jgi:hypothetical protein